MSSKVNEKEHTIIVEYINYTGESISNLIRKVMIRDVIYEPKLLDF